MDKEQTTTLQLFQQKLNGELKIFPQSFFQFLTQKDLKEMMRYFIENFLQWDEKKICNEFNTIVFIRYGLRTVLNNFFEGDPKLVLDLVYPGKYQYQDLRSLSTQKKKEQIAKSDILNAKLQGNLKSFPDGFLDSLTEQEKVEFIRFFIEKVLNWTPEEALERLNFAICKEYKIYSFIYQEMGGIRNALMLAYPEKSCNIDRKKTHPVKGAQENASLVIFKEKLEGKRKTFPIGYYQSLTKEDNIILMRYFIEEFLNWTPEEAVEKLTLKHCKEYGMYGFIHFHYGGIRKALIEVYPEKSCNIDRKNPNPVKGAQEKSPLVIFKEKLEGKREIFPKGFYQSLTKEDKIILMQYFVEDFLKLTPQKVSVATFKKYGLYNFIREVYGSVKKAFALTYPEKF